MSSLIREPMANASHVPSHNFQGQATAALLAVLLSIPTHAAAAGTWATGPALQQRLAQPVDIVWTNNPLRKALESLSRAQKVAILLDRRVDPGQKVDLSVRATPLESVLQLIARHRELGVCRLGAVVYLGPPQAASRLRALAALREEDVRRLPPAAGRKFLQLKALAWEELAVPRDLLAQLGRENRLEIAGLNRVPHDLWPAADLPPMSLVDRLTLIAIQFDLTFEIAADGASLTLAPIPDNLAGTSQRPENVVAPQPPPKTKRPPREPAGGPGKIRVDRMSVQQQPVGAVLKQLAERLKLDLRIDYKAIEEAGISLDQRVSATVENVTIDELFREVLKTTRLTFRRTQKVIEIGPAK